VSHLFTGLIVALVQNPPVVGMERSGPKFKMIKGSVPARGRGADRAHALAT
jgi:hypothetical protein